MLTATFRILFLMAFLIGCSDGNEEASQSKGFQYVSPTIDKYGHFRKGHVRKSVSTDPHAIRNQARSRYYYQTRGKYNKRKRD